MDALQAAANRVQALHNTRRPGPSLLNLLSWVATLAMLPSVGQAVDATWTGGTGVWSDATGWSTNPTIPDNGAQNFIVRLDNFATGTSSALSLDLDITVDQVDINVGDMLTIDAGSTLVIEQPAFLQSCGEIDGTLIVNGTLLVDSGVTCFGNNRGLIQANPGGVVDVREPIFDDGGTYRANGGTLRGVNPGSAVGGGLVEIVGDGLAYGSFAGNLVNSSTGLFQIGESSVVRAATGGTLFNPLGGRFVVQGALGQQSSLSLFGPATSTNAGLIELTRSTSLSPELEGAVFVVNADNTLTGGGTLSMAEFSIVTIGQDTEFLHTNHTIEGRGEIQMNLNSHFINGAGGVVDANVPGEAILWTVQNGPGVTNEGTLRASLGADLFFEVGLDDNLMNTGTIEALSGSRVRFRAFDLDNTGGLLFAADGGRVVLDANSTLTGGRLDTEGTGVIEVEGNFLTLRGTIENDGLLRGRLITSAFYEIGTAGVTLTGDGVLDLGASTLTETPGATLTNAASHRIHGDISGGANFLAPLINLGSLTGKLEFRPPDGAPSHLQNGSVVATTPFEIVTVRGTVSGSGFWIMDGGELRATGVDPPGANGNLSLLNGGVLRAFPFLPAFPTSPATLRMKSISADLTGIFDVNNGEITVDRHLRFALTDETNWNWNAADTAKLIMAGGVGASTSAPAAWGLLEIGGEDLGTDPVNHVGALAGFTNNFEIPRLTIGANAHIRLIDAIDNGNRGGVGGADEALYVDTLEFEDGAGELNLAGLNLYYNTLVGSPSQIIDVAMPPPPICDDGRDNDGDRRVDFPDDPGCQSAVDNNEVSVWIFGGLAQGGTVDFDVNGVALQVTTVAGETAEQVAVKVAAAINADSTLTGFGITASNTGATVTTNGAVQNTVLGDPGLTHGEAAPVPLLGVWGTLALILGLSAATRRFGFVSRGAA